MHRPILAALRVAPLLLLAQFAAAIEPAALDRARQHLERNEAREAVRILESALPAAASDRPAFLQLLRRAYESAARQAEAAGKPRDAELFRDNLAILNRKSNTEGKPPTDVALERASEEAIKQAESARTRIPAEAPPETIEVPPETIDVPSPPADERDEPPPTTLPPSAPTPPATSTPGPVTSPQPIDLAEADAAFLAKKYDVAGHLYAALDRERRLPAQRNHHWAYCRWVDLVRRINANPTTADEWATIDSEIKRVQKLSPNNWYGEYLRKCVAERSRGARRPASDQIVLRGSAPEEPTVGKPDATANPSPRRAQNAPARPPAQARGAEGGLPLTVSDWQVRETTNFRVYHLDAALAERVAEAAEAARAAQSDRWAGVTARGAWSPKCDIYLYPSARTFSKMTGQPEESPGFSTMGLNSGKIVARRINLRADHPNLEAAILPHEITHVILADLFPTQQIPRWADEGIAVLAEPSSEQKARASDLGAPLAANRLFKLNDLMVMDYPDGKHWALYYAQSVSLTRFLVDLEGPARFIEFVQGSQRNGPEAELRRVYKIEGFADLQARWLAFARAESATMTVSTPPDSAARTR